MKTVVILMLSTILVIYARPQQSESEIQKEEDNAIIPYEFQYKVENAPTNTYFGQNENNHQGNGVIGKYYVALADGRLMTVEYLVDGESGFIPRISYQNNSNYTNSPQN